MRSRSRSCWQEAFDGAKMVAEQKGSEEVNVVVAPDPVVNTGGDGGHGGHGAHSGGHGGAHSGGHGDAHSAGHGGGYGGHGGGHGSGHGHDDCEVDDCGHSHGEGHGHGHSKNVGPGTRHDTEVRSMVLEAKGKALDMRKFQRFLGGILQEKSVDLYRYKGVMAVNDKDATLLYILQGVHDMPELTFSGEWPEGKPIKTQIVLIGRKLDEKQYRAEFAGCLA